MNHVLIGRQPQIEELSAALESPRSELIAVYGRRRVGKTFLVREVYRERIVFEIAGLLDGNKREQLQNFDFTLRDYFPDHRLESPLKDWITAFHELGRALDAFSPPGKCVLFFDELPWLASPKSGFLRAFGNFWNSYAEKRDVVIVICGSAAAWMIRRVIQHRGGLHNRITRLLALAPFTLAETVAFCESRQLDFSRYQLLQIYMTLGGVPAYLEQLRAGQSAVQNIQRICFSPTGFLRGEFDRLFASLFSDYEVHVRIIKLLAERRAGLTREVIRQKGGFTSGGALTRVLNELFESGFIGIYPSFEKRKRDQLYRLTDFYTLFHLTFVARLARTADLTFTELSELPGWRIWSGYAFENVWLAHPTEIKKALGITGVSTRVGTYYAPSTEELEGVQIDLLLDRRDHAVNLCEVKFSESELNVSAALSRDLRRKKRVFTERTGTKKQVLTTLLTVYGTTRPAPALEAVHAVLDLDALL